MAAYQDGFIIDQGLSAEKDVSKRTEYNVLTTQASTEISLETFQR